MSVIASKRPGVFSNYEASGIIYSSGQGKAVGIIAQSAGKINHVYSITRASDAEAIFGNSGIMTELCSLALQNGAKRIAAVSTGTSNPDYEAAFAALASESDVYVVICDSEESTVHNLLKTSVVDASEAMHERIGIVACSSTVDHSTWAAQFNSERVLLVAQNLADENGDSRSGCFLAAALAGKIAGTNLPTASLNGVQLDGISRLTAVLSENEVDEFILSGITPFEVIVNLAEPIRVVTSRTKTDNVNDTTFRDINTILVIDEVIPGIRTMLKKYLLGAKNNSVTRASIATQTTLKLQEYLDTEIIESYEQPVISQSKTDPTVCVVGISFVVAHGLNQILISTDIKV